MNNARKACKASRFRVGVIGLVVASVLAAVSVAQQTGTPEPPPASTSESAVQANPIRTPDEQPRGADSNLRNKLRAIRSAFARLPAEEPDAAERISAPPAQSAVPPPPPPPDDSPRRNGPAGPRSSPFSPNGQMRIPIAAPPEAGRVEIKQSNGTISLSVRDVALNRVLMLLGQQLNLNIVCADNVTTPISVALDKVPLENALNAICAIAGCSWTYANGIIHVTSLAKGTRAPAEIQGRQVRVFRLDFASAKDMEASVKGMLSPVGQAFITEGKATDNRKTQEVLVVEDLPAYVQRIEQYVSQVDMAPRQVMIEAHVLSVELSSDNSLGINFSYLFNMGNKNVKFETTGFANPAAPQAFFFSLEGADLNLLLEALRTQTHAKTLASPKVLVVNGQDAQIHVGGRFGYPVVTTTETSSQQSFNFLETGVMLKVTPRISQANQVLMHVQPEVSKGQVNQAGYPEEETTKVQTDIMLPDGRGMVIGGLIQEQDLNEQRKVAFLGDLWMIGRLFQYRKTTRQRKEYIVTLIPRIVPDCLADCDRHAGEVLRAETPLFQGPLEQVPRPWESPLPDAVENPQRVRDQLPPKPHFCGRHGCTGHGRNGEACFGGEGYPGEPYYAGGRQPEPCSTPLPPNGGYADPAARQSQSP